MSRQAVREGVYMYVHACNNKNQHVHFPHCDCMQQVAGDLQRKPKDDSVIHVSSVAGKCAYIIANVCCKASV